MKSANLDTVRVLMDNLRLVVGPGMWKSHTQVATGIVWAIPVNSVNTTCAVGWRTGKTLPGIGIFSFQGPMGRWVQRYCDATYSSRFNRWPFGSTYHLWKNQVDTDVSRQCHPTKYKISLEVLYLSIWPHEVYMGIIAYPKMIFCCFILI